LCSALRKFRMLRARRASSFVIMGFWPLGRPESHDHDGRGGHDGWGGHDGYDGWGGRGGHGGAHSSNPTQCAGFSTAPRSTAWVSLAAIHSNSAAGTVSPPSPAMNDATSGRFAAW
jgi:hypothetical protein